MHIACLHALFVGQLFGKQGEEFSSLNPPSQVKSYWNMEDVGCLSQKRIALNYWSVTVCFCLLVRVIFLYLRLRRFASEANSAFQGLDTHVKAISTHAFCYDSRPNSSQRMEWFVQNYLMGGFVNSNTRKLCNAKYVTIDDHVFVVAIKPIKKDEELFVYYKVR